MYECICPCVCMYMREREREREKENNDCRGTMVLAFSQREVMMVLYQKEVKQEAIEGEKKEERGVRGKEDERRWKIEAVERWKGEAASRKRRFVNICESPRQKFLNVIRDSSTFIDTRWNEKFRKRANFMGLKESRRE